MKDVRSSLYRMSWEEEKGSERVVGDRVREELKRERNTEEKSAQFFIELSRNRSIAIKNEKKMNV